jgi:hypothetical protein
VKYAVRRAGKLCAMAFSRESDSSANLAAFAFAGSTTMRRPFDAAILPRFSIVFLFLPSKETAAALFAEDGIPNDEETVVVASSSETSATCGTPLA